MRQTATAALVLCLLPAAPGAAQTEAALKAAFEGRRVVVKMDMPATSAGVDVHPESPRPIDYKKYGDRLAAAGVALPEGDAVLVTLVKVKKDLIEFQLGGGGYDGDSGDVAPEYIGKSNREKQLEDDVKAEKDPARKRTLQRQLDDERNRRAREQRRANETAKLAEAANKERVAEQRLRAGSRFNLRYPRAVPAGLAPEDVVAALRAFVDFSGEAPAAGRPVAAPAAGAGLPRKGMLRADAERDFGRPQSASDRREGALTVTTLVFLHGEQRISAEFVEDVLIRYTISSR